MDAAPTRQREGAAVRRGRLRVSALHRTAGLLLALLLIAQAATGLLLVWRDDLLVAAVGPAGPGTQSVDEIIAAVATAAPRSRLERVTPPLGPRSWTLLYLRDPSDRRVVARYDQASGDIVPLRGLALLPFLAFEWHDAMLTERSGHAGILLLGLALTGFVGTGLWLWWPGRSGTLRAIRRAPRKQRPFVLHRAAGLFAAAPLLWLGVTGAVLEAQFLFAPAAQPAGSDPKASASIDPILASVALGYPSGALADVRFAPDGRSATINMSARDSIRPLALDHYSIDLRSGTVVRLPDAAGRGPADALLAWMYPLHAGHVLGSARGGVMSAFGLLLLMVPGLGVAAWWRRRRWAPGSGAGATR